LRAQVFAVAILAVTMLNATVALAESYPIAGIDPAERPAGAPVITEFQKDAAWNQRALTGISEPYPGSLRFLEDEGAWFTPFNRPGMPPPYDIRAWHDPALPDAGELTQ
jgi:hypothetical protein